MIKHVTNFNSTHSELILIFHSNTIYSSSENHKGSSFTKNVTRRDNTYDEEYWSQLASVIDQQKERMWDAMISGFKKYSLSLIHI